MKDHTYWMAKCLELAKKGAGRTAPNPMVGCVIVADDRVVGEGWHPKAGAPHAEIYALEQARGQNLDGATLYVNLEPCNHYGRTPPCTEAIIRSGIKQVVIGSIDPNPLVAGKGCARLQEAGITVITGILGKECDRLNAGFFQRMRHQLPLGILKYAMTLDGKIATDTGHSFWVTGHEARQVVYELRSTCDAVITGGATVRQDNPLLTTHGVTDHSPLRVVLSRSLDLPTTAQIWQTDAINRTLLITPSNSQPTHQQKHFIKHLETLGVEVLELEPCTPLTVMAELAHRGCNQVLWECGGNLSAQAIQAGVIQRIYAFIAPKIIGGTGKFSPIGNLGRELMSEAMILEEVNVASIGSDWLITGHLVREENGTR
jgi:diaminohydroxyphosphoribosylaminopyrimidine deaminase/5-amino-6-(5-phosphoribosylamino)uracil reductase